jgi:hypothetical protein
LEYSKLLIRKIVPSLVDNPPPYKNICRLDIIVSWSMKIIIVIKHENTEIILENQVGSIFLCTRHDKNQINIWRISQTIDSINCG